MSASSAKHAVVRAKLKFTSRDEFIEGFLPLVSKGGLFIRTRDSKPESTPVRFEFRLADDTPVFVGEGVVRRELPFEPAHPGKPFGMLVSLRKLNRASKEILDEILALKIARAAAAEGDLDAAQPQRPLAEPTPPSPVAALDTPTPAAPVAAVPETPTPATPRPAVAEAVLPPLVEKVHRPAPDPSLPRPQLLSARDVDDLSADTAAVLADEEEAHDAPRAEPARAAAAPEPTPANSIFGGDDDGDADPFAAGGGGGGLFGGEGFEDELDGLFAEVGLVSDGSFDFSDGPADLFGSALPRSGSGSFGAAAPSAADFGRPDDEPAVEVAHGGGGLLSLEEDELEDEDEDFLDDFQAPAPQPALEPAPVHAAARADDEDLELLEPEEVEPDEPAPAPSAPPMGRPTLPPPPTGAPAPGGFQFKLPKAPPAAGAPRLPPPKLPPPRLPPPPAASRANPLDDVSVASADLPPPPRAGGFKSPSIDDLETEADDKKNPPGGLFNKLFGGKE